MMATLTNRTQDKVLISDLKIAVKLFSRMIGLLGTKSLSESEALWIHRCNSIHTFFMNYAIDCVFVDKDMKVKAVKSEVKPDRLVFPIWGARSVIEMRAGAILQKQIRVGDQLHVDA